VLADGPLDFVGAMERSPVDAVPSRGEFLLGLLVFRRGEWLGCGIAREVEESLNLFGVESALFVKLGCLPSESSS